MTNPTAKQEHVKAMFNDIAPRYDFLNHLLSFGIDKLWRKRLIKGVLMHNPQKVLDVATGTADLAIALARKNSVVHVDGVDIADKMVSIGREKLVKKQLDNRVSLSIASAEYLPFNDSVYDAAMVAFGVRNFEDPLAGLQQIFKVLKKGGTINILEFTTPKLFLVKQVYRFYFTKVLPFVGKKVSGHSSAYTYLPNSVKHFKEREGFVDLLNQAGFSNAHYQIQSFGIAAIYRAQKL